jgi:hypothetical protein
MDEEVQPEHVRDDYSANQLIERVAWAVCDASDAERRAASTRGPLAVGHTDDNALSTTATAAH